MGRARKPHALMQLFEEEDAPAPFINAAAAASAYGLGLGLNGSQGSADVSYAEPQQPQISIPSFDDDSDDDASGMTMRGNMSMASNSISEAPPTPTMPSAPTTFPPASLTAADPTAEDANTVRARPHMTHLSSSTSTGSSGSGTFGGGGDTGEAGGDSMTTSISTPSAMDTATAAGSPPQGDQSHTVGGRQRSDSEAMPPPPKPKLNTDVLHLRKVRLIVRPPNEKYSSWSNPSFVCRARQVFNNSRPSRQSHQRTPSRSCSLGQTDRPFAPSTTQSCLLLQQGCTVN